MPTVYFVARHLRRRWPELDRETAWISMDQVPRSRWMPLENIWIVSTYLRLQAAGMDVRIVDRPMPYAVNVFCEPEILATKQAKHSFLVLTQGDRERMKWVDYSLVQSPVQLRGYHVSLIHHWPQPGLIGRDLARGQRIERIGYIGPVENLAASMRTESFRMALAKLGVELVIRNEPDQWHDFSDLDLFLAVRDWPWRLIRTKPATKLVHAWLTGVPGLLGPEPSYQFWGEDGVDYFQVKTPDDVLNVVLRLKNNPELYESVRQRGFVKGKDHDETAVLKQWINLLRGPVRQAYEQWRDAGPMTWKYREARRQWHRMTAPVRQKWFTLRSRGWRAVKKKLCRYDQALRRKGKAAL